MTTPKVKCKYCEEEGELYLEIYPPTFICQDCGEPRRCPKCKSKEFIITQGSTNKTLINSHKWGLCTDCLFEWDLGICHKQQTN